MKHAVMLSGCALAALAAGFGSAAAQDSAMDVLEKEVRYNGFHPFLSPLNEVEFGTLWVKFDVKGVNAKRKKRGVEMETAVMDGFQPVCRYFPGVAAKSVDTTWKSTPVHVKYRNFNFLASLLSLIPGAPSGGADYTKIKAYSVNWGQPKVHGIAPIMDNPYSKYSVSHQLDPAAHAEAVKCGEFYDSLGKIDKKTQKSAFVLMQAVAVDDFDIGFDLNPQALPATGANAGANPSPASANAGKEADKAKGAGAKQADAAKPPQAADEAPMLGSLTVLKEDEKALHADAADKDVKAAEDLLNAFGIADDPKVKSLLKAWNAIQAREKTAIAAADAPTPAVTGGDAGDGKGAAQTGPKTQPGDAAKAGKPGTEASGDALYVAQQLQPDAKCGFSGGVKAALGPYNGAAAFHLCQTSASSLKARVPYYVGYQGMAIEDLRGLYGADHTTPEIGIVGRTYSSEEIDSMKGVPLTASLLDSLVKVGAVSEAEAKDLLVDLE